MSESGESSSPAIFFRRNKLLGLDAGRAHRRAVALVLGAQERIEGLRRARHRVHAVGLQLFLHRGDGERALQLAVQPLDGRAGVAAGTTMPDQL